VGGNIRQKLIKSAAPWRWDPSAAAKALALGLFAIYALCLVVAINTVTSSTDGSTINWVQILRSLKHSASLAFATLIVCGFAAPFVLWSMSLLKIRFSAFSTWMILPFCLPSVAVGGMFALTYGNSGLFSRVTEGVFGFVPFQLMYQSWTPVLGAVWMNLSIGLLFLARRLANIPEETWFQAKVLSLSSTQKLFFVIVPYLRPVFVSWMALVFLACFSSYGLILMLSGSTAVTTLELATWQELWLEGRIAPGFAMMLTQMTVSLFVVSFLVFSEKTSRLKFSEVSQKRGCNSNQFYKERSFVERLCSSSILFLFALFYILPFVSLILEIFQFDKWSNRMDFQGIWESSLRSSINGIASALIVLFVVLIIVPAHGKSLRFGRKKWSYFFQTILWLPGILPGMLISLSLFQISFSFEGLSLHMGAICLAQALLALPVASILYTGAWNDRLGGPFFVKEVLGLSGWQNFLKVEVLSLYAWILMTVTLVFSLSTSDITVVNMFSIPDRVVLTQLIFQMMGSYRFWEASVAIFVLIVLSGGLGWFVLRGQYDRLS
jgi:thiamine transport system permease protein